MRRLNAGTERADINACNTHFETIVKIICSAPTGGQKDLGAAPPRFSSNAAQPSMSPRAASVKPPAL
jgi:hypothetical protein